MNPTSGENTSATPPSLDSIRQMARESGAQRMDARAEGVRARKESFFAGIAKAKEAARAAWGEVKTKSRDVASAMSTAEAVVRDPAVRKEIGAFGRLKAREGRDKVEAKAVEIRDNFNARREAAMTAFQERAAALGRKAQEAGAAVRDRAVATGRTVVEGAKKGALFTAAVGAGAAYGTYKAGEYAVGKVAQGGEYVAGKVVEGGTYVAGEVTDAARATKEAAIDMKDRAVAKAEDWSRRTGEYFTRKGREIATGVHERRLRVQAQMLDVLAAPAEKQAVLRARFAEHLGTTANRQAEIAMDRRWRAADLRSTAGALRLPNGAAPQTDFGTPPDVSPAIYAAPAGGSFDQPRA